MWWKNQRELRGPSVLWLCIIAFGRMALCSVVCFWTEMRKLVAYACSQLRSSSTDTSSGSYTGCLCTFSYNHYRCWCSSWSFFTKNFFISFFVCAVNQRTWLKWWKWLVVIRVLLKMRINSHNWIENLLSNESSSRISGTSRKGLDNGQDACQWLFANQLVRQADSQAIQLIWGIRKWSLHSQTWWSWVPYWHHEPSNGHSSRSGGIECNTSKWLMITIIFRFQTKTKAIFTCKTC